MHVVLIDDDEFDIENVRRSLGGERSAYTLTAFASGAAAIAALGSELGRQLRGTPHVILVDLLMPEMDGFQLLAWIKNRPDLRNSPVFVLTASDAPEHVTRAHEWAIAGYIVKSQAGPQFDGLRRLLDVYARINLFPPPLKH